MTASPSRSVNQTVSGSRARFTRLLTIPIYLGCTLAFVADVTHQIHLAFGLFYIPLICTAVFHRNPHSAWWLASIAAILVTIGFFFPEMNPDRMTAVGNSQTLADFMLKAKDWILGPRKEPDSETPPTTAA